MYDEVAHGPHDLEAAHRQSTLEAVQEDHEPRNCAHRSNATLWKRSFETIRVNLEAAHRPHHMQGAPRECSLKVVCTGFEDAQRPRQLEAAPWECALEA
eukprot:5400356-Amphidinium_carterae.1